MKERIFVQIASYRDPQLIPTIKDCIEKAAYPERLTFGICHQHADDEWDTLEDFKDDSRFKIIDVPHLQSKGLCWARSLIQKLWEGEEYTMQLDSHHRFIESWDKELINMMDMTGSPKPIISTYATPFEVGNDELNPHPCKMVGNRFTDYGTIIFMPSWLKREEMQRPGRARFVSGHFFFTLGKHCEEYKYDPNLYFGGDEISLSIRSYTLGYDLFHPHQCVVWHEYTREGRSKHWTDFTPEKVQQKLIDKAWHEMDQESKRRLRHMLQIEYHDDIDLGEYGLGNVRSHRDYERYAGINFKKKLLHTNTLSGIDPPVNDDNGWDNVIRKHKVLQVPQKELDMEYDYALVKLVDKHGHFLAETRSKDLTERSFIEINEYRDPYKWIIEPNKDTQWVSRLEVII